MPAPLGLETVSGIDRLVQSFELSLYSRNRSPKTIRGYVESVRLLAAFLVGKGMPTRIDAIRREHVEAFIADQLQQWTASTAATRFRCLQQFFKWAVEDGEITSSPMVNMKAPTVPETPVPVLSDDDLRRLLGACDGKTFNERRDAALIRLFFDSGIRLAEMTGLRVDDIDLRDGRGPGQGQGLTSTCPLVRSAHRPGPRPVPSPPRAAYPRRSAVAMARCEGPPHRLRRRADAASPLHAVGHPGDSPTSAPTHLRPRVARPRRCGGRSDAPCRLAVPPDAPAIRGIGGGRAGTRCSPPAEPRGPDMTEEWSGVRTMLGGVVKSQILKPEAGSPLHGLNRRIVDVACHACGERLAMVTDEPGQPAFTAWSPTIMVRRSSRTPGEPFWTIRLGDLPAAGEEVTVHCFTHGDGIVTGEQIASAIAGYRRRGRVERVH